MKTKGGRFCCRASNPLEEVEKHKDSLMKCRLLQIQLCSNSARAEPMSPFGTAGRERDQ